MSGEQGERFLIYTDERDYRRGRPYWKIRNGDSPRPGAQGYHTEWVIPASLLDAERQARERAEGALENAVGEMHDALSTHGTYNDLMERITEIAVEAESTLPPTRMPEFFVFHIDIGRERYNHDLVERVTAAHPWGAVRQVALGPEGVVFGTAPNHRLGEWLALPAEGSGAFALGLEVKVLAQDGKPVPDTERTDS